MKIIINKGNKVLFEISSETEDFEIVENFIKGLNETETIKSVELIFDENTTFIDYQNLINKGEEEKLLTQIINLNE